MTQALYELAVERYLDASPATVFKAWTARLEDWWAPKPWTTRLIEQDLRPGSRFAMVMSGPQGESPSKACSSKSCPMSVSCPLMSSRQAGCRRPRSRSASSRSRPRDRALATALARHWDEVTMKQHGAMGFASGWGQVAEQLRPAR